MDVNKIDFEAMSKALNVKATEIKLVIKGPRHTVEQQSIGAIQTVEQACKLFKQAKSTHRKRAITKQVLLICGSIPDLRRFVDAAYQWIREGEWNVGALCRLKYQQLYTHAVQVCSEEVLISDFLVIDLLYSNELFHLCEQELLSRCDRRKDYDFAMKLTGRYDETSSFDADPFKLKAAEFANSQQALELLKQEVEGYDDLQPESKLLQILVEKAAVLFPKN